jgi:alpha-galactosidase
MRNLVLCFSLLAPLLGAADLAGTWHFESAGQPGPNGQPGRGRQANYVFKVEGNKFTGTSFNPTTRQDVIDGVIDGNSITFKVRDEWGNNGRGSEMEYKGTLNGDELTVEPASPPQAGRGGRGGRGGFGPLTLKKISSDTEYKAPPEMQHKPFGPLQPIKANGLALTPPMGWNSWNKFAGRVDDKAVREIADAMAANGMRDAGYLYVNIDDTWEGPRDKDGNIASNEKFPDMKALTDYVHSKGLKIGIYSGPGPLTCAQFPASYNHEEQDAKTWAAWGFDYLKYDWCSARAVYHTDEMKPAYQKMAVALRSTKRPIVFSLCQYGLLDVGEWGASVGGNLWRTTGDISDRWDSMIRILDQQPGREKFAGPGHWNDPDMLEIGNGGMTDTEYRTHMTLWCMLAAPLLAGNDLRSMSDATKEILMNKEVIAIDQDKKGVQGVRASQNGDLEVWKKPLANGMAVALVNRGADTASISVKWADLGITKKNPKVHDVWTHKDVDASAEFTAQVPSHGTVAVIVR